MRAFCEAWEGKEVHMGLFGLGRGVIVKFCVEKLNSILFKLQSKSLKMNMKHR